MEDNPFSNLSCVGLGLAFALSLFPPPASAAVELDGFSGVGINVADLVTSARFYEAALGFKEARRIKDEKGHVRVIALSLTGSVDAPLVVLHRSDHPLAPGHASYGRIIVASHRAQEMSARIKSAGYEVTRIAKDPNGPGSMEVWTRDPDGYEIEVFQAPTAR